MASGTLGFEATGLSIVRLDLDSAGYSGEEAESLFRGLRDSLRQAALVTVADRLPLDYGRGNARVLSADGVGVVSAHSTRVTEDYLETLGISLLSGRGITGFDEIGAEPVVVISEPLALQLFPGGNAVGERLSIGLDGDRERVFTVVGVAADFVSSNIRTRQAILVPLAQNPVSSVFLMARPTRDRGMSLALAIFEDAISTIDPDFAITNFTTGEQTR